jgi:hypothetical protein
MINENKKELSPEQSKELLGVFKARFGKAMNRHKGLDWMNTYSMIVQQKARTAAGVFVTTVKGSSQGKNTSRKTMRLIWQQPWALNS